MAKVVCELPWPPTVNHAWRPTSSGGKILGPDYKTFKKAVGDYVLEHRVRRFWTKDNLAVSIVCRAPNWLTYDIDNRVKTVLDALAGAGVIENDKMVDMLVVVRGVPNPPRGSVLVKIEEMSALPHRLMIDRTALFDDMLRAYTAPDSTNSQKTAILHVASHLKENIDAASSDHND